MTFLHRDSYMDYLKAGVKPDTWCSLRNSPLHHLALFPDAVIKKTEEDIAKSEADAHPLRNIVLQVHHIPGQLNVIADKLFLHNQVIQTEWPLHQGIFDQICKRWYTPDQSVYHQVQQETSPVCVPCLVQRGLGSGSFETIMGGSGRICLSTVPVRANVINKILSPDCRRVTVTAPGWPNMS